MPVLYRYWRWLTTAVVMMVLLAFVFRPALHYVLRRVIVQRIHRFESATAQKVTYKTLSFPRLSEVLITDFRLSDADGSPVATVEMDSLRIDLFVLGFLSGHYIRSLAIDTMFVNFYSHEDSSDNYRRLVNAMTSSFGASGTEPVTKDGPNLNEMISRILDQRIPSVRIQALYIHFDDQRHGNRMALQDGRMFMEQQKNKDAQIELSGRVVQNGVSHAIHVSGMFSRADHRLEINGMFDADFRLPFVSEWLGFDVTMGSFDVDIFSLDAGREKQSVRADVHVGQLGIHSSAISGKRVSDLDVRLRTNMDIIGDSVSIHASDITLSRLTIQCSGSIARVLDRPRVELLIQVPMIRVQDFLVSLPEAFSSRIRTAKVDGAFEFSLDASIDWASPDSIRLDPHLRLSPDFKVRSLGDSVKIEALRDTFTYVFARGEKGDTAFVIGRTSPWFVPYDSIPEVLVQSVVLSEDGSFFKNSGFNILQMERSLGHNIKVGKFSRGASTISMQLSKNLFLSREKTLARKFQEIIITWLWNHDALLVPNRNKEKHKKRLMEIYLNIIEWGPDIYGVASAAKFYFDKRPQDLTVSESVFLATIIPNPKKYERYFDRGTAKRTHVNYMNLIKKLLYRNSFLSEDSLKLANAEVVRITGPASALIEGYKSEPGDADVELEYEQSLLDHPKP